MQFCFPFASLFRFLPITYIQMKKKLHEFPKIPIDAQIPAKLFVLRYVKRSIRMWCLLTQRIFCISIEFESQKISKCQRSKNL